MKPRWRTSRTAGSGATARQQPLEQLDLRLQALERALLLEHVERGQRGGAGERVARVGVAVEEGAELLVRAEEALVDPLGGERGGQRQVAAGDALGQAQQVGRDALVLAGEHPSRCGRSRSPPRRRSAARRGGRTARAPRAGSPSRVHEHARGALHQRLDDHRRDLALVLRERARSMSRGVARLGLSVSNSSGRYSRVEQVDPADRHRADRVAVVGVAQADEARALRVVAAAAASTGRPS